MYAVEHLVFKDGISFRPFALCKLPETFGISASKSWYSRYFNTQENVDYVEKFLMYRIMALTKYSRMSEERFLPGTRVIIKRSLITGGF